MTKLLSVRVKPAVLSAMDERAAELGRNRSQYVQMLVEQDLEEARKRDERGFRSEELIGSVRTGIPSGDNVTVRETIRKRLDEKNR